jgi:tetratricopeptide (TPR) repeat protein
LIASAIKKENNRDYKGMLADANSAIALDPRNSRAYVIRGRARERSGNKPVRYIATYKDYTQAIALDPNNAEAYLHRAGVNYSDNNVDYFDNKKKLADYSRAIAINPNYAEAYYRRAVAYSRTGNYKEAAEDYSRAISSGYNMYYERGEARFRSNDFRGAIEDYDRVIAANPTQNQAYYFRGMSKFELGDKQGALADYNKAIEHKHDAYVERATVKSQLGDRLGAIADLKIAAKRYKEMIVIFRNSPSDSVAIESKDKYQKVMKEIARLGG